MSVHQNFPAGAIITKGLGSDVSTGMLITGFFQLGPINITITPILPTGGGGLGGGSIPLAPGEIHGVFKPVTTGIMANNPGFYTPQGTVSAKEFLVKVNLTIKGKTIEKTYTVQKGKVTRFITLMNMSSRVKHGIYVAISSVKRFTPNITIKFNK